MQGLNFIAIDFETATGSRASICEAGICVVRGGKVAGVRSWLVRPEGKKPTWVPWVQEEDFDFDEIA